MKSPIALAAFLVVVLGSSAVPAFAQDAAPTAPTAAPTAPDGGPPGHGPRQMRQMHMMDRDAGGMRLAPGFLSLACSDRGSEKLEIALVRLSHRLDLTADQQALFDAFRGKALTTQTSYADSCKTAMPTNGAQPDLLAGLKAGLEREKARVAALTEVLPDFEAFYNSLTDEQKAKLMPHRADMGRGPGDRGGMFRLGPPMGNR